MICKNIKRHDNIIVEIKKKVSGIKCKQRYEKNVNNYERCALRDEVSDAGKLTTNRHNSKLQTRVICTNTKRFNVKVRMTQRSVPCNHDLFKICEHQSLMREDTEKPKNAVS